MPRRLTLAVAPLLLALALAGCTESTRLPPPEPPAAGEPLFASDEEALAAATAAYEEYLAAVDSALADPGSEVEYLVPAGGQALVEFEESLREFLVEGYSLQGVRSIGHAALQQSFQSDDVASVIAYICEDISDVVLLDRQGNSLTTPDRPNYTVLEVQVDFRDSNSLVVSREFWENADSC